MEQVSSREVYRNAWMTVREDVVRLADGTTGIYGVVEKQEFAVVVPRERGGVWLVEQFRYPAGRRGWELPMGSWPADHPGGDALALAQAELAEETGLRAATWRHLGHLMQAYGYSTQGFDVFLATDLTPGTPDREASEQDMVHRWVSDEELHRMVLRGDIVDATTLAALALLAHVDAAG